MSKLQNSNITLPFIDYIPAELKENKVWEIVYYAIDPYETKANNRLKRKRHRVRPFKCKKERRIYAKSIIIRLNQQLMRGWTPFDRVNNSPIQEQEPPKKVKLFEVFDNYLHQIEQQTKKDSLRPDTLRAYTSYVKNLKAYLITKKQENAAVSYFNEKFCRDFLDMIFYERKNSARTHNNYLGFISLFNRWLIKREHLKVDFTGNIDKIRVSEKIRTIIPLKERTEIFNHLKETNKHYFALCYTAFYCLIRRTELSKLKVADVLLKNGIISISADVSKNRKSQVVTIPSQLIHVLIDHLKNANNHDFLFSDDNFKPGETQLEPKRISDTWSKYKKKLNFSKFYQWYSLKDTGITNYLHLGIPTIDVRNQARHYSIKQTEEYLPKTILKASGTIQSAKLDI
ncbi:tyrosine-type recombinase/integrase [Tenacibaculum finnmarkense]|uniref:tyrosine-type recombinase/integrase n=1 Tax=Tenacibaculum finnmarkense TaxID=2781243 RepID=UPI00187BA4BD|nr:site-specific integrase [Tenacibaculum finnmarkense]MBE7648295.1 tyrosine-type recombinase/integrase [Tenacibaculum finnmarkense genomovar ulcerans]